MIRIVTSFLFLFLLMGTAVGQSTLFTNEKAVGLVRRGADKIYGMEPDSAWYFIRQVDRLLPGHPVVPLMKAELVLWQNIPILRDSVFVVFDTYLTEAVGKSLALHPENPDRTFFEMSARGLMAEYHADNGEYMRSFNEASRVYTLLKTTFDQTDVYPEFLFTAGIYNYFREVYPERHPVYKPLMWFFKSGDKELGLEQIRMATQRSLISRVEAVVYLSYIYLRYEEDGKKAQSYMKGLYEAYPQNPYIIAKYLESLNVPGSYDRITPHMTDKLIRQEKVYYKLAGYVFKGIYLEKAVKNDTQAFDHYMMAVSYGESLSAYGDYFKSLAYLGAGNVLKRGGRTEAANRYFSLAVQHAQTREVEQEAKHAMVP
ncbi:MAG: hypothetical protein OEY56_12065 [Cyclobacteriaceae bacterium]|nr:hypothetical protein [Cyclobacteriaceae bacterium]